MAHETVHQAVRAFVRDPNAGPTTDQSKDKYAATLFRFAEFTDKHILGHVTSGDVYDFMRGVEVAASTRRTYFNRLDSFFQYCVLKNLITENPVTGARAHFTTTPKPVKVNHWLTAEEVEQVLAVTKARSVSATLRDRDLLVLHLGFFHGLRRQEIVNVQWEDVQWEKQSLRIKGKGDKLAEVWVTGRTMNLLANLEQCWLEDSTGDSALGSDTIVPPIGHRTNIDEHYYQWGRKLSVSSINRIVRLVSHRAGIEFSPHDMRRTFAGLLQAKGYGIDDISKALRHSDYGVTQRYLQSRQDAAFSALQGLDF